MGDEAAVEGAPRRRVGHAMPFRSVRVTVEGGFARPCRGLQWGSSGTGGLRGYTAGRGLMGCDQGLTPTPATITRPIMVLPRVAIVAQDQAELDQPDLAVAWRPVENGRDGSVVLVIEKAEALELDKV